MLPLPRISGRASFYNPLFVSLGLAGALASCGPTPATSTEPPDQLVVARAAILTNTGGPVPDVSYNTTAWSTSKWQSETDGQTAAFVTYVAFNAEPSTNVVYPVRTDKDSQGRAYVDRVVCPGASQVGTNFDDAESDEDFADAHYLPVPFGIAAVWGDPAVATGNGHWYVSSLVAPLDVFNMHTNIVAGGINCFRTSDYLPSNLPVSFSDVMAGSCIFQSPLGQTSFGNVACLRRTNGVATTNGYDFFDGGSMATSFNAIYVAYTNEHKGGPGVGTDNQTRVAMYKMPLATGAWAPVPGDNAIPTDFHPSLASSPNLGSVFMVTSSGTSLILRSYSTAWSAPVTIATDYSSASVTLNDNVTVLRGHRYPVVTVQPANPMAPISIVIFYPRKVGAFTQLQGVICSAGLTCTAPASMRTSSTSNAALPGTAAALTAAGASVNGLTYWSDAGLTGGQVKLYYSTFSTSGSMSAPVAMTQAQKACPGDGNGYWGDYDRMWVSQNNTSLPFFIRSFTDSTHATCDTTSRANLDYRSQNTHVSLIFRVAQ
jgi:hypothetical protein